MANRYIIIENTLYRWGFSGELFCCLIDDEAYKVVGEAYSGTCGGHVNSLMLAKKILRQDYYWSNMEEGRKRGLICKEGEDKGHHDKENELSRP